MGCGGCFKSWLSFEFFIKSVAVGVFFYALCIALYYSGQPPLEEHAFRQAQTALTAHWFVQEGFRLAYHTPVAGAPWAIPFEFPLYQYLVALFSQGFGSSLIATGRVVSFLFLMLCVFPVSSICGRLGISKAAFYSFVAFLFSSPIYLFWGRTFMIETAALFFSVMAIKFFLDFLSEGNLRAVVCFLVFIVLSILQKATTGLPVLGVMAFLYLFAEIKREGYLKFINARSILLAVVLFGTPLALGVGWTYYSDIVKSENVFGAQLTSTALSSWNWGSLAQRTSGQLYGVVIWERIVRDNLAGFMGGLCILGAVFFSSRPRVSLIVFVSSLLGVLPLFIFSNLHIVHNYYQSASVIFLIFALSVSLVDGFDGIKANKGLVISLFLAVVASNYYSFWKGYYKNLIQIYDERSGEVQLASVVRNNTKANEAIVVFGHDWSSSLAFLSERKSFTVPEWFSEYDDVLSSPEHYLGNTPLGAVVLCPASSRTTVSQLMTWSNSRSWKVSEIMGCYISVPERHPVSYSRSVEGSVCQGHLDYVGKGEGKTLMTVLVRGWTTHGAERHLIPESVYVTLTDMAGIMRFYEATQYSRPDVNDYFGMPEIGRAGFGRIIDVISLSGKYGVGIARLVDGNLELCQFRAELQINK